MREESDGCEPPWEGVEQIARLYEEHAPRAQRFAYLLTGDRVLASDLVQDAFLRLGGRLGCLRDPEAFETYLRRTVLNLVRMHARRRRIERASLEREGRMRGSEATVEPYVPSDEAMRRALLALPPRQRAAVVLRFYEDLPVCRIAEILRCPQGTVRSLVHRALKALRGEIGRPDD